VPHPHHDQPPVLPPAPLRKRVGGTKDQRKADRGQAASVSPKRNAAELATKRFKSTSPDRRGEIEGGPSAGKSEKTVRIYEYQPQERNNALTTSEVPNPTESIAEEQTVTPPEVPVVTVEDVLENAPYRYHAQRRDGHYQYEHPSRELSPEWPGRAEADRFESSPDTEVESDFRLPEGMPDPESLGSKLPLTAEGYHVLMDQIYRFHCTEFQLLAFVDRLAQNSGLEILDHDAAHEAISDLFNHMKEPVQREASRNFANLRDMI
ncbi:hypothetical protein FOL47_001449, partial [Perkinsus chesapeaki]